MALKFYLVFKSAFELKKKQCKMVAGKFLLYFKSSIEKQFSFNNDLPCKFSEPKKKCRQTRKRETSNS